MPLFLYFQRTACNRAAIVTPGLPEGMRATPPEGKNQPTPVCRTKNLPIPVSRTKNQPTPICRTKNQPTPVYVKNQPTPVCQQCCGSAPVSCRSGSRSNFPFFYADREPDRIQHFTVLHMLKNLNFFILTAVPVYIVLPFLVSVKGVIIFNILNSILKIFWTKISLAYWTFGWNVYRYLQIRMGRPWMRVR